MHAFRRIRCRHVVVTVPITVLQREDITFSPPLPQLKQQAIQRVKMSNAIKVLCTVAGVASTVQSCCCMSVCLYVWTGSGCDCVGKCSPPALCLCNFCAYLPSHCGLKQPQCTSQKHCRSSVQPLYVMTQPTPHVLLLLSHGMWCVTCIF